ncbi:ABC transporter ATP-binding protein [Sulfolobus sp. A20-N-F8]|nr:ABC transporter ATP-binding protein [Sulfolobus sp. A20-N-F8]
MALTLELRKLILPLFMTEINFLIEGSKVIGILGESGNGKSTLAKVMAGLIKPVSGYVLIDGRDIFKISRKERGRLIQLVLQDPYTSLDPEAKVIDTILEGVKILKIHVNDEMFNYYVNRFGITELLNKRIYELSGGERQRINILRSMLINPKVIIYDEPTSMVDSMNRREVLDLICSNNSAISIIISHNVLDMSCVDTVFVMRKGKIIARGKIEELRGYDDLYVRTLANGLLNDNKFR